MMNKAQIFCLAAMVISVGQNCDDCLYDHSSLLQDWMIVHAKNKRSTSNVSSADVEPSNVEIKPPVALGAMALTEEAHSGHRESLSTATTAISGIQVGMIIVMCSVILYCLWMGLDDARAFLDKNFLVLGIVFSLGIGLCVPQPGAALQAANITIGPFTLPQVAVIIIFFLSGMALDKMSDVNKPRVLLLGLFFVLFLTPLLAIPIKLLGTGFVNPALLQGACLFCAVPCTLSSGVAMVKQANGNVPLALALTACANLLGIFTVSWTCTWIFSAGVTVSVLPMILQLMCQTLAPFATGLLVCLIPAVRQFATSWKGPLGKVSNSCIFFVVWLMASVASGTIMALSAWNFSIIVTIAMMTHMIYRTGAIWTATFVQFEEAEWVTFVLMCSQKSLPKCVSVLSALPAALQAQTGTFIIPCILAHFSQLVIDGYLTQRWEISDKKGSEKGDSLK